MACIPKSKNNPASAVDKILSACLPEGAAVAVGLSGGMDSVSLLEATLPLQGRWKILVCHVNHGISLHADSWERFCRRLCEKKNIPIIVCRVPTPPVVASEDWARQQRMAAFAGLSVKAVLAAHHANDQAETVLFRLLRGSGVCGMAAMRPCATLPGASHIQLLRPWLHIGRDNVARYARRQKLSWVEDEDNDNLSRRRNFLRQRALPILSEGFPDCGTLLAAAPRFAEDADLLADLAHWDEKKAAANGEGFSLVYWQNVGLARVGNWLRTSLFERRASGARRHVDEAARQIMAANADSSVCFKFRHTCLRAWRGRLFWDDTPSPPSDFVLPLKAAEARLPLEELGGTLMLSRTRGKGLSTAKIADGLLLRLRQGGERLSIIGRPRRAVADLLREAEIMPWRRMLLPLLFVRGRLAAVPGIATAADFVAAPDEDGLECGFEWR